MFDERDQRLNPHGEPEPILVSLPELPADFLDSDSWMTPVTSTNQQAIAILVRFTQIPAKILNAYPGTSTLEWVHGKDIAANRIPPSAVRQCAEKGTGANA